MKSSFKPERVITKCQFIIEQVAKNSAARNGEDLPLEFWNNKDKWANFFKMQSIRCSQLAKKYSEQAILKIVQDKKIYNLFPKWIEGEIKKIQEQLDSINYEPPTNELNVSFTTGYSNKSKNLDYLD